MNYGNRIVTNRKVVAMAPEVTTGVATPGTKVTIGPTEGDKYVRSTVLETSMEVNPTTFNRNLLLPSFSQVASLKGSRIAKFTCKTEIKGSGNTYTVLGADEVPAVDIEPAVGRLLRGCGCLMVSDGADPYNYIYNVSSLYRKTVQSPTWTIALWNDGVIETMYGARGNARIVARKDEPVMLETEYLGIYDGITDGDVWTNITFEASTPPVAKGALCYVNSEDYSMDLSSFEIDFGNQLALAQSINSSSGLLYTYITGRKPTLRIDPTQRTLTGTYEIPWYSRLLDGASIGGIISFDPFLSDDTYTEFGVFVKGTVNSVRPGDREGLRTSEVELELNTTDLAAGDDEVKVYFYNNV